MVHLQGASGLPDSVMTSRVGPAFDEWRGLEEGGVVAQMVLSTSCWWRLTDDLTDVDRLTEAIRVGVDLQLLGLLEAMTRAAACLGQEPAMAAASILAATTLAARLLDGDDDSSLVEGVFRFWRVRFLARWLRPDSGIESGVRVAVRALDQHLGPLMIGSPGAR